MADGYVIKFRDIGGSERVTKPDPSRAGAVRHARVLKRCGGTVIAITGPDGDVDWAAVDTPAEATARPKPAVP